MKIHRHIKVCGDSCGPSTRETEAGRIFDFEVSLVYRASSRTAKAIQRNPVLKHNNEKENVNMEFFVFVFLRQGLTM